jgi:hypothetical protein
VYLLVFAVLWVTALPAYLDASDGRTPSGSPTGSLAYVILCTIMCVGVLSLVAAIGRPAYRSIPETGSIQV